MATRVITTDNIDQANSITVEFNNGDLEALKNIKSKWKFKDLESALRFGLAVLTITEKGKLLHETENDKIEKLSPTHDLIETI